MQMVKPTWQCCARKILELWAGENAFNRIYGIKVVWQTYEGNKNPYKVHKIDLHSMLHTMAD